MIYHKIQLEQLIWWNGPSQIPFLLNKVDQIVEQDPQTIVVGTLLWEAHYSLTEDLTTFLKALQKRRTRVFLVVNSVVQKNCPDFVTAVSALCNGVLHFDFWAWFVYDEILVKKTNKINTEWSGNHADRFLFLTGKADRFNRVGLLWKFFQNGLLSKAVWSLYVQDKDLGGASNILARMGVERSAAEKFIIDHQQVPDNAAIVFWPNGGSHYTGIPYDTGLYSSTKFRVISETMFEYRTQNHWPTEKTWLTILNHCPFIMAGPCGSLRHLESLGFRTFRHYLPVPDYDDLPSTKSRLDAIVANTAFWLENTDAAEEINQDVIHNYHQFVRLVTTIELDMLHQMEKFSLEGQVADLVDIGGQFAIS